MSDDWAINILKIFTLIIASNNLKKTFTPNNYHQIAISDHFLQRGKESHNYCNIKIFTRKYTCKQMLL